MRLIAFSLFFALATLVAGELSQEYIDESFENFKDRFSRVYHSQEEVARKKIFAENLQFVTDSNKLYSSGHQRFQVGINNFADYTDEEFKQYFLSRPIRASEPFPAGIEVHRVPSNDESHADTSQWDLLTPVKNQGTKCASGWAFAATACLETALAMQDPWYKLTSLSEQNLIDCSMAQENTGCASGSVEKAFEYVLTNNGIDIEKSYPYDGKKGQCRFKSANQTAALSSYVFVEREENALADAVSKIGPVAVMIDATPKSFRFYQSGVYDDVQCSGELLTHGMTVTGFDYENWHLRNSFGADWGEEQGTMRLSRAKGNLCGIFSRASYPILKPKSTI